MERTSIQKIIRLWLGRQTRQRDEQALKTWLVSSKDADEKREACFGEWQQMNVAGDPKATREALSRFQERRDAYEDRLQRRRRLMRVLRVAASVALLVVCGTAIWFGSLHYYHSGDTKLAELIVPEDGLDSTPSRSTSGSARVTSTSWARPTSPWPRTGGTRSSCMPAG